MTTPQELLEEAYALADTPKPLVSREGKPAAPMTDADWKNPNLWEAERIRQSALALARKRLKDGEPEHAIIDALVDLLKDEAEKATIQRDELQGTYDINRMVERAYALANLPPSLSLGRPQETRRVEALERKDGWNASVAVKDAAWAIARAELRARNVVVMRTISQPVTEEVADHIIQEAIVPAMRQAVGEEAIREWTEHDVVTEGLLWPEGVISDDATVPAVFDATLTQVVALCRTATHVAAERTLPSTIRESAISSLQHTLDALVPILKVETGKPRSELKETLMAALSKDPRRERDLADGLNLLVL